MADKEVKISDKEAAGWLDAVFDVKLDPYREMLERTWFRNILYYLGEQWINWMRTTGNFGFRFRLNRSIPTPVSNIIRDYVREMKALMLNKSYKTRVWPNSSERNDKDAAKLGDQLLYHMDTINDGEFEDIKEITAMWLVMTGNGFTRTYAEVDNGLFILNSKGEEVTSRGEVAMEAALPFNIRVPILGDMLRKKSYVGYKSLKEKEWVEDTYKIKVTSDDENMTEVAYQRRLMRMVAEVTPWKSIGLDYELFDMKDDTLVVVKEIEFRPTVKYPSGRYVIGVGKEVVKKESRMPIPVGKDGQWYYTFDHFPYNYTPGAFWACGGIDDLISPQNTINEVDQGLKVNRKSIGQPWILSPSDLVLKRITDQGSMIRILTYDSLLSGGAGPKVVRGEPYPQQILEERRINREVAQQAAGDPKNILQGQSPHSGASGYMVDVLREAAEMGHAPDIKRFYRNWNRTDKKKLVIAQVLYTEERTLKIKGAGNIIMVRAFKGSDLRNNTDVRLELDSGNSTTQAGRNQFLLQLVQSGFFGDLSQQPQAHRELLERMGVAGFSDEENLHRDRAERENSIIAEGDDILKIQLPETVSRDQKTGKQLKSPGNIDPLFRLDSHMIHIQVHDQLIFSPEFETFDKVRIGTALAHRQAHLLELEFQLKRSGAFAAGAPGESQQGGMLNAGAQ